MEAKKIIMVLLGCLVAVSVGMPQFGGQRKTLLRLETDQSEHIIAVSIVSLCVTFDRDCM